MTDLAPEPMTRITYTDPYSGLPAAEIVTVTGMKGVAAVWWKPPGLQVAWAVMSIGRKFRWFHLVP